MTRIYFVKTLIYADLKKNIIKKFPADLADLADKKSPESAKSAGEKKFRNNPSLYEVNPRHLRTKYTQRI